MDTVKEPTQVSAEEARDAAHAATTLAELLETAIEKNTRIELRPDGVSASVPVRVPVAALQLFVEMLKEMAQGNAVTLVPYHAELTTQEAADILNVSRPYVVKLLEQGEIPFRKVGNRRRIKFTDLMEYKRMSDAEGRQAAAKLTTQAQELGLDY